MKAKTTTSGLATAIKPRPLLHATTICALVMLGFLLMMLHAKENSVLERSRTVMREAFLPIIEFLSTPAMAMTSFGEKLGNILTVYGQNATLKADNEQLMQWQSVAGALERENNELRSLLGIARAEKSTYVTARIVQRRKDLSGKTIIVRFDSPVTIASGYAAITANGLIGRVIEAGERSAKILLLSDSQSRVPVQHEQTGQPAILTGNKNGMLLLKYVKNPSAFKAGDRIVTSNHMALIPANIPVGEVVDVQKDGVVIRAYADVPSSQFTTLIVPSKQQLQTMDTDDGALTALPVPSITRR